MTLRYATKRMTALLLALAILVMNIPTIDFVSVGAENEARSSNDVAVFKVADPITMDDWKHYFGADVLSTENSGGVWMDKSVTTDASVFGDNNIALSDSDGFLVALSAIASDTAITGLTNVPTDTMLVLDLSSSMYLGSQRDPSQINVMLQSVNEMIDSLQTVNRYNRVGVVVYFGGGDYLPSTTDNSVVLLALDRYTYHGADSDFTYLKPTITDGKLQSVDVNSNVTDSLGKTVSEVQVATNVAGTYTQLGMLNALEEMLAADPTIPEDSRYLAGKTRLPVMVLMSGSKPTAATANYTDCETAGMGNNTVSFRNPPQTDFVTQLTAAYVKEMLDEHYKDTTPLFYSLSLGDEISMDVMNPYGNDQLSLTVMEDTDSYTDEQIADAVNNRAIDAYWDMLLQDGKVDITVQNCIGQWNSTKEDVTYTVSQSTISVDGKDTAFPSNKTQKYYVDEVFTAANAQELADVFQSVLTKINIQSHYHPTLVEGEEEVSGYISFVDKIGEYMHVSDVKGILIDDTLYSGALLAKNFVTGGGDLGTFSTPTELGDNLVWAVQQRLGVDANTARDLLGLAYSKGQLSYVNDTQFSNYIGWYANAKAEYLGFWYEGMTTMPDPYDETLPIDERPMYIMKSYEFLGAVDEKHGVSLTDLMYATIQVRYNLLTGEETVVFGVPAALIPIATYNVTLDENGGLETLEVGGAEQPIRLVYEVALDEEINRLTVHELVDEEYMHINDDGTYSFYTNQFETDQSTGYGTVNTYSYFRPSLENARYYYTEDSPVYIDQNGTIATGELDPNGTYYRAFEVYSSENGLATKMVYEKMSSVSLEKAQQNENGEWYVPTGTVHMMLEDYIVDKTKNPTDTLPESNIPFVDTQYSYIVGATLGNNGEIVIVPETALKITNAVDGEATEEVFEFVITRTDYAETTAYQALLKNADGTSEDTAISFHGGVATIELCDGQSLYIYGMTAGAAYTVTEKEHAEYKLLTINGEKIDTFETTLVAAEMSEVLFENARKGKGSVAVVKRVMHELGSDYVLPDIRYDICADLGIDYANATIKAAHSGDESITSVTADEQGKVYFSLKHTQQFELVDLPEGTTVTFTELNVPTGFTPIYYGVGVKDQNTVTIQENTSVSMIISNVYTPEAITADITVSGTKTLRGRENDQWTDDDVYAFELQKFADGVWTTIATETVDKDDHSFDFTQAMSGEVYTKPGNYSYQVVETIGDIKGITYDHTVHAFSVEVGDPDMTGLCVTNILSYHNGDVVRSDENGLSISMAFVNTYSAQGEATATIDIKKQINNPSNSDLATVEKFRFGLYDGVDNAPAFMSDFTDHLGEARIIATFDTIGTYHYTLREIVPDMSEPAIVYTTESYDVQIVVSAASDGTLTADTSVTKNGVPINGIPMFTNDYILRSVELTPKVFTHLQGRDLRDSEFTFEIQSGDNVLATGTNDTEGNVTFDVPLCFDKIGDYYYDIAEVTGEVAGIVYDTNVYRLHISITDGGDGTLHAHYHVINTVSDVITFENTYKPAAVSLTLGGEKVLIGRNLVNEEFTFMMRQTNVDEPLVSIAHNFTDGSFYFDPICYDTVGTYTYAVQEVQNSTTHGIVFDDSVYLVNVTVTDDLNGQLAASYELTEDETVVQSIVFENSYAPTPVDIVLEADKIMVGRDLNEGEFEFTLYCTDANWENLTKAQTVTNDADGHITFDPITFVDSGVYRYIVKEKNGGETIDGVTYDDEYYRILIVAKDNQRGILEIDQTMIDSTNTYCLDMTFMNTYGVTDSNQVTIEGTKTLIGRELANNEFTFALYEADQNGNAIGEPIDTIQNRADGYFAFMPMDYTQAGMYRYIVRELALQPLDNVTYDTTEYLVTIGLEDDGFGGLAIATYMVTDLNKRVDVTEITFTNTYVPPVADITVDIGVVKTVKTSGEEIVSPEGFTFVLESLDAIHVKTAQSDADGKAAFELVFTEEDIGKTYSYALYELDDGKENMLYSVEEYTIKVIVGKNNDNQLTATLMINNEVVSDITAYFENEYVTPTEPTTTTTTLTDPVVTTTTSTGSVTTTTQTVVTTTTTAFVTTTTESIAVTTTTLTSVTTTIADVMTTTAVTTTTAATTTTTTSATPTTTPTTTLPKAPQTGDNTDLTLWVMVLFVSGATFAVVAVYKKRSER